MADQAVMSEASEAVLKGTSIFDAQLLRLLEEGICKGKRA